MSRLLLIQIMLMNDNMAFEYQISSNLYGPSHILTEKKILRNFEVIPIPIPLDKSEVIPIPIPLQN